MDNLINIYSQTIERYSKRYKEFGKNVRTLGWGSEEQQEYRFQQSISQFNFAGRSILDIGCGFGDYYSFFLEKNIPIKNYTGIDINEDLINAAKSLHSDSKSSFAVHNILEDEGTAMANVGVMLGVLNFNLKGKFDNYQYSFNAIEKAFELVDQVLIVDFLSSHLSPTYSEEDFVFYHSPEKMMKFAMKLSANVVVKHDYEPAPQKEFMLFIYK